MIKQSDTDITEMTEIVRGKQQVTAINYLNSEGGQQVTFHSALTIQMTISISRKETAIFWLHKGKVQAWSRCTCRLILGTTI